MTERKIAKTVASEVVTAITGIKGLLKTYDGQAMAHLCEADELVPFNMIVGGQPLTPPTHEGRLALSKQDEKGLEKFYAESVLVGWWYTRTVLFFTMMFYPSFWGLTLKIYTFHTSNY